MQPLASPCSTPSHHAMTTYHIAIYGFSCQCSASVICSCSRLQSLPAYMHLLGHTSKGLSLSCRVCISSLPAVHVSLWGIMLAYGEYTCTWKCAHAHAVCVYKKSGIIYCMVNHWFSVTFCRPARSEVTACVAVCSVVRWPLCTTFLYSIYYWSTVSGINWRVF